MADAAGRTPYMLVYGAGAFTPGDPLGLAAGDDGRDWSEVLAGLGYHPSQRVGDTDGLSYELYEHGDGRWLVCFQTAGLCSWVDVRAWPDLIALLRDLSLIALAGLTAEDDGAGNKCPAYLPAMPVRAYPGARR